MGGACDNNQLSATIPTKERKFNEWAGPSVILPGSPGTRWRGKIRIFGHQGSTSQYCIPLLGSFYAILPPKNYIEIHLFSFFLFICIFTQTSLHLIQDSPIDVEEVLDKFSQPFDLNQFSFNKLF